MADYQPTQLQGSLSTEVWTFQDLIDHCLDFLDLETPQIRSTRKVKRAALEAYRAIANRRNWSYYQRREQIPTVAAINDGTVVYDHTGGSSERIATFTFDTTTAIPDWVEFGRLRIGNKSYRIRKVLSASSPATIQLSERENPGEDVAASSFTLYRDTYPMPTDFSSCGKFVDLVKLYWMTYIEPNEFLERQRLTTQPAEPRCYTFLSSEDYPGQYVVGIWPYSTTPYTFDFIMRRNPRPLVNLETSGTCTTSGTALTVTSGTLTNAMAGSVIRFAPSGTAAPTSLVGLNAYGEQRILKEVTSSTVGVLDAALTTDLSLATGYTVSDPLDIEVSHLLNCLLRAAEYHCAIAFKRKDLDLRRRLHREALLEAFENSNLTFDDTEGAAYLGRLQDLPYTTTMV